MGGRRWVLTLLFFILTVCAAPAWGETPQPLPTPEGDYTTYTVQAGDTMSSIAARFGLSIRTIARANRIVDIDRLSQGQQLYIPAADAAPEPTAVIETSSPSPTASAPTEISTPTASEQTPAGIAPELPEQATVIVVDATATDIAAAAQAARPAAEFGVELFSSPETINADSALLTTIGASWAKLEVNWATVELSPGAIDFSQLDLIISILEARGQKPLLTLVGTPTWARAATDEQGPPDNLDNFATFAGAVATRFAGRVAAYEIWNEPNLRRNWNSTVYPIGAASYGQLLARAYTAIKAADPAAQVISAGLAPTGIDDGINAINDRRFLFELMAAGLPSLADGIGVHPFGFAAPPDMLCCEAPAGVASHFGDPSFYFASILTNYQAITNGSGLALWVTAFGWGTTEIPDTLPRNFAYVGYNTAQTQAEYTLRAIEVAPTLAPVQVMILSNLNGCAPQVANPEACYRAVIRPDGQPSPVLSALVERAATVPSS